MITYKIHFIRHGITQGNMDGRYIGLTDLPLCEEGYAQLRELQEKFKYPQVDAVYTSPLSRCTETAEFLYPHREQRTWPKFAECDFGSFEGKTIEELKDDIEFEKWIGDSYHIAPPGGESGEEFTRRIISGLDDLFGEMMQEEIRSAAVITHGGVIMTLMAAAGLPKHPLNEWAVGSGMGYTILMTPQMWMRDGAFEVYSVLPEGLLDQAEDFEEQFEDGQDGPY